VILARFLGNTRHFAGTSDITPDLKKLQEEKRKIFKYANYMIFFVEKMWAGGSFTAFSPIPQHPPLITTPVEPWQDLGVSSTDLF
jgi:hypothetical protein